MSASTPALAGRRIVLAGAGKMGGAMLDGWLAAGLRAADATVLDPFPGDRLKALGVALNPARPRGDADVLVIAVKPQMMAEALPALRAWVGSATLVVSVAAGKAIASYEAAFGADAAVVRVMPNTPAAIGRGISVCCANARVSAGQRALADSLAAAVGKVEWIDDEGLMDAVTAVSGSGPAYVFHLVEAMAAAGARLGLEPEMAMRLARATVSGAGALMDASPDTAEQLRKNVTSPGGTTAAALAVLMGDDAMTRLFAAALEKARDRGSDLAG